MLNFNFRQFAARFLSSEGKVLGAAGYNLLDANGVDVTYKYGRVRQDGEGFAWERNRVVDQGLNYMLNAALRGEGVVSTYWLAPFAANVTPAANLTAANYASTMTEFTNYTETNRQAWTTDAAATALELVNAAAPALITIGSATGTNNTTIWGCGLIASQGKSATGGPLLAAQKRATALTVEEGFELRIKYRIAMSSS